VTDLEIYRGLYEVTTNGRVYSVRHNWRGYGKREMRQTPDDYGYPSVRLSAKGKRTRIAVHRLVAAWYLPNRPSQDHQIRHLDGDKSNNHVGNLRWGTHRENMDDRQSHGRTSCGKSHSVAVRAGMLSSTNPYYKHARTT
jgi:hypothetical protein